MITPRLADIMQTILELYLPRKKTIKAFTTDSVWALLVGVLIGCLVGIVLVYL